MPAAMEQCMAMAKHYVVNAVLNIASHSVTQLFNYMYMCTCIPPSLCNFPSLINNAWKLISLSTIWWAANLPHVYYVVLTSSHCMSTSVLWPRENSQVAVAWPTSHTMHVEPESTEASRREYGEARVWCCFSLDQRTCKVERRGKRGKERGR